MNVRTDPICHEYVLAQFAESPENVAALTGVIDAGFTFKLFV